MKKVIISLMMVLNVESAFADFEVLKPFFYYNDECIIVDNDEIFFIKEAKKGDIIKDEFFIIPDAEKNKVEESNIHYLENFDSGKLKKCSK